MRVARSIPRVRIVDPLHRFMGTTCGLLLFLLSATGTLTVFRDEIRVWVTPVLRSVTFDSMKMVSVDVALDTFCKEYDLTSRPVSAIRLPAEDNPAYELLLPRKEGGLIRAYVDPTTGSYLGSTSNQLADFLFQLHANLSFGSKFGRYAVGLAGVALTLMLITGLVIHRHILRDLFRLRLSRSRRLAFADLHKRFGVWGFVFHLTLAATGMFLGLKGLLVLPPAFAAFRGDVAAAQRELREPPVTRSDEPSVMSPVASMIRRARQAHPAFVPRLVTFQAFGDANARVEISGSLRGHLLPRNEGARFGFAGNGGALVRTDLGTEHAPWRRVGDALSPLHYGDFGGLWLQCFYFILGVGMTSLVWSGTMVWIERSRPRHRAAPEAM